MNKQQEPRLRFQGFVGAWEEKKLGEVVQRITRKNTNLDSLLPLTISAQNGLIAQTEFFDNQVAGKNLTGYYLIENGEFAYNKSYSNGYPWGAIKRLDRHKNGVLSTLYILFKPTFASSQYLVSYFDGTNWHGEVASIAGEGARNHGLLNIPVHDFFEIKILLPCSLQEQTAIGNFFRRLDSQITESRAVLEKSRQLKKAMLAKMFPANGEKLPKIRFKGFEGEWESRKLGEVANFTKGSGYSKSDLTEEGFPIILYGRLYTQYETVIKNVDTFVSFDKKALKSLGNEVIVPASGETSEDIARASVVYQKGVILGGDLNVITPNKDIDSAFLALSLTNGKCNRELAKKAQGKSVVHLHNSDLQECEILFPFLKEQTAIGNFFRQLDETIALQSAEVEKLNQLKKGLLAAMLV